MLLLRNVQDLSVIAVEDGSAEFQARLKLKTDNGRFPLYEQISNIQIGNVTPTYLDAPPGGGAQGPTGPQGVQGLTGPMGPKGDKGDIGDQGGIGPSGSRGLQGAKGDTGDPGPQGTQGIQGVPGNQGSTGAQGNIGPAGPTGVNWTGAWSVATAYAARDAVMWAGSSYVALNSVAAGGTPPAGDATNWLKITSGGGRIVRAKYTGADITLTNGALSDVTGTQIVVPANSGPCIIRASAQFETATTSTNGWARHTLIIRDVEAAATLKQGVGQGQAPASGQNISHTITIEEEIANSATARTFLLQAFCNLVTATAKLRGPGTTSVNLTPFLEAVAE